MNETQSRFAEVLRNHENYGPGRPPLEETWQDMERILEETSREPGIPSAKVARKLQIPSSRCSMLARRLESWGLLTVELRGFTLYLHPTQL